MNYSTTNCVKWIGVVLLCSLTSLANTASAQTYDLAIKNVNLVDAVAGLRRNQSVYIRTDTIAEVVSAEVDYPAEKTIDAQGKFLMPGLWDMHVHIVYEQDLVKAMPDLFLDYGITSVRDTGALLDKIAPEVERWQTMGAKAPDLYFSGPLLDGSLVVYDGDGRPEIGISNSSVDAALASFATLQAAGVHFIKIYELVSPDVFATLVEAANAAELPIAAHIPLSMRAETAGPRVNSMEHLRNVDIACADLADELHNTRRELLANPGKRNGYQLRSHLHSTQRSIALPDADPMSPQCLKVIRSLTNTIQVPTLRLNTITRFSPAARQDWQAHLERLPQPVVQNWLETAQRFAGQTSIPGNQLADWSLKLIKAMAKEGVPIGAGTDTPIGQAIPGYSLHTELERLVDAGLTTTQALHAATVMPAKFFSLEHRMGQIQPGMEADLVLLDADPLADIRNTRSIKAVVSDGVQVR